MAVDNFPKFAKMVADDFQAMAARGKGRVFVVDVDGEELCALYLDAFPEGTNPKFKERTEHDCSCCKQFKRRVGNVVVVDDDGTMHTVWDGAARNAPAPYNIVAQALSARVQDARIVDLFCVAQNEPKFGAEKTLSQDNVTEKVITWNHFYTGDIPAALRSGTPDAVRGAHRTNVQVFERGLIEIKPDAVTTALMLIDAPGDAKLYRGEEHKFAVTKFQEAQQAYLKTGGRSRDAFVWTRASDEAARFRNSVIGTLLQDLSEDVDVEKAVAAFEAKVAPTTYKRTSAPITPKMVSDAMAKIAELGLEPALERRFARIDDISVRDVLWVDSSVKPLMKGGLSDVLMAHASANKAGDGDEKRAEAIDIDDFIKNVLPQATGMEVLFKGEHANHLMSLTAPVHPDCGQLFRWNNNFAWSVIGNVTDAIKERVKKAGGKVDGAVLRISLSWGNKDDLDLHVFEPGYRHSANDARGYYDKCHVYFRQKRGHCGGELDVDMNANGVLVRDAVENIVYMNKPVDGAYRVEVNNYRQRELSDVGFTVEIENNGKVSTFSFNKIVRDQESIHVATLHVKNGVIERFEAGDSEISTSAVSQERWGLKTETYAKVNAMTFSPNYWGDNAVGHKLTFFILDGCRNDEPARGVYNEFLHPRLEPHRKVFEVIGEKTKCQPAEGDGQLSGLGFSSTKKNNVLVKVTMGGGKKQRLYNVQIGA